MRIVSACGALALMVELIFIIQLSAASILSFLDEIKKPNLDMISTSPFPPNFLFGTASSSYQFEGAYLSDGKGLSNWDLHSHIAGKIVDGSNGDVAVDQYHRYLEDVNLMESLGVNSYRLSISWARILPKGRFGDVNLGGINYYNSLINALLLKGIQPFVTLTHFDLPQELEDRYGGWLSPESQEDFGYYADICFKYFGDRVKYWATFNEPNIQVIYGYRKGIFPPSRCSTPFGNCTHGNSEKEPFLAAHNIILSHATAVNIYRTKHQREQGGSIGFVMSCIWYEPISNSTQDELASERALAFNTYWFLDPVILGRYPAEMTNILGSALPRFSSNEEEKLKKGLDFIGINHYTSFYTKDCIFSRCIPGRKGTSRTEGLFEATPIGEPGEVEWISIHPQGMEKTVTSIKERYNNIPMFITENGYGVDESAKPTLEKSLQDVGRVKYMSGHLDALVAAMRKGADVRGYFTWSLLDNFEWVYGYTVRFGLHYVDYATQKRTPKLSAAWYTEFIARYNVSNPMCEEQYPVRNKMYS